MYSLAIGFSVGILTGVVLVRYGIGLGTKIVQKTQEGSPVFGADSPPIEQTHTGEREIEDET